MLGETIRQIRHDRKLTQEQLAELADVHVNWISMVERGHRNPSAISMMYLARALDVPVGELWKDFDRERPKLPAKNPARLRGGT